MKYILLQENLQKARKVLRSVKLDETDKDYIDIRDNIVRNNKGFLGLFTYLYFKDDVTKLQLKSLITELNINRNLLKKLPIEVVNYKSYEKLTDDLKIVKEWTLYNKEFVSELISRFKKEARNDEDLKNAYTFLNKEEKINVLNNFIPKISMYKNYIDFKNSFLYFIKSKDNDIKSVLKKIKNSKGSKLVYNKDNIVIAIINDKETSKKLGSSSWCISYKEDSRNLWDSYNSPELFNQQYFLWNFNVDPSNIESKVGITIEPTGEVRTSHLKNDRYVDIKKYCEKYNIDFKIFKPLEINEETILSMLEKKNWNITPRIFGILVNNNLLDKNIDKIENLSDVIPNKGSIKLLVDNNLLEKYLPYIEKISVYTTEYLYSIGKLPDVIDKIDRVDFNSTGLIEKMIEDKTIYNYFKYMKHINISVRKLLIKYDLLDNVIHGNFWEYNVTEEIIYQLLEKDILDKYINDIPRRMLYETIDETAVLLMIEKNVLNKYSKYLNKVLLKIFEIRNNIFNVDIEKVKNIIDNGARSDEEWEIIGIIMEFLYSSSNEKFRNYIISSENSNIFKILNKLNFSYKIKFIDKFYEIENKLNPKDNGYIYELSNIFQNDELFFYNENNILKNVPGVNQIRLIINNNINKDDIEIIIKFDDKEYYHEYILNSDEYIMNALYMLGQYDLFNENYRHEDFSFGYLDKESEEIFNEYIDFINKYVHHNEINKELINSKEYPDDDILELLSLIDDKFDEHHRGDSIINEFMIDVSSMASDEAKEDFQKFEEFLLGNYYEEKWKIEIGELIKHLPTDVDIKTWIENHPNDISDEDFLPENDYPSMWDYTVDLDLSEVNIEFRKRLLNRMDDEDFIEKLNILSKITKYLENKSKSVKSQNRYYYITEEGNMKSVVPFDEIDKETGYVTIYSYNKDLKDPEYTLKLSNQKNLKDKGIRINKINYIDIVNGDIVYDPNQLEFDFTYERLKNFRQFIKL